MGFIFLAMKEGGGEEVTFQALEKSFCIFRGFHWKLLYFDREINLFISGYETHTPLDLYIDTIIITSLHRV